MNARKLLLPIAPVLLLSATGALALQQEAGFRARVGDPAGAFSAAVDNPGVGLGAHYGLRPVPGFTLGVGLDFLIYGHESTTYRLPLVEDFDLTTDNYVGSGFLFAQWRPIPGPLQPYAEARFGGNYLWTESRLEDKDFWNDEGVARKTNYDDGAMFWGVGGGLLIKLRDCDPADCKPGVLLDLKVLHQQGGEARYLTEGDIEVVDNVPIYHPTESETDLTSYELGVVLTF